AQIGPTNGDYLAMLSRNATLLPPGQGDNRFEGDLVDLELQKARAAVGTSIRGRVFNPSLAVNLSDVEVVAEEVTTGAVFTAKTLSDGSFVSPAVEPGTYRLRTPGTPAQEPPQVTVAAGQAVTGVVVNLVVPVTLTGRV